MNEGRPVCIKYLYIFERFWTKRQLQLPPVLQLTKLIEWFMRPLLTGILCTCKKCQPVSKFFQKKLEYLDWSPIKFLSVRTGPP